MKFLLNTFKDVAYRDEYCNVCGYPFDTGDLVYRLREYEFWAYCSKGCIRFDMEKIIAAKKKS